MIDLSGTTTDGDDVTDVALDDNLDVAFGIYTNHQNGNAIYEAYRWINGAAMLETTVPITLPPSSVLE